MGSIGESQRQVLALLQAVQHELHAAGNAKFFEDTKQIIAHDCGSTLIGFSIAFLGLDLYRAGGTARSPLLFPLLIAAIPLLDTCLAVVRRMRSRDSLFKGDRRHFYDLLFLRGWTARRVALTCYGIAAALAAASLFVMRLNFAQALFASGLIVVGLLAGGVQMGALRPEDSAPN